MITYDKLRRRPALFQRVVGITVEEFDDLVDIFASYWQGFVYRVFIENKDRQRQYGGGNTPKIQTIADKLLFVLIYVRLYPLQLLLGFWFGVDESSANRWVHRLMPILEQTLGFRQVLPKRGRSLDEIIAEHPDLKGFLIDGMEQPIRRPKNPERQRQQYSGKKKRHTKKNIVLSDVKQGYIHYLGKTQEGRKHDKRCADEEKFMCKQDVDIGSDLGFMGLKVGRARIIHAKKKPKGKELTETDRVQNRVINQIRIAIEHGIGGIKRSRIAADTYRNMRTGFEDLSMLVACGLHNYRVNYRYAI